MNQEKKTKVKGKKKGSTERRSRPSLGITVKGRKLKSLERSNVDGKSNGDAVKKESKGSRAGEETEKKSEEPI